MIFSKFMMHTFNAVDAGCGKVFGKVNNAIQFNKVPEKLGQQLRDVGVNVAGKNTRRVVLETMNDCMRKKIDGIVAAGAEIATFDPQPDMLDLGQAMVESLDTSGLVKNFGLTKTANAGRTLLSFRPESLSPEARSVVQKYLRNPINVAKAYAC